MNIIFFRQRIQSLLHPLLSPCYHRSFTRSNLNQNRLLSPEKGAMDKKWDLKVLLMVKCVDLCLCATPLISPSRDHRPPVLGQKAAFHSSRGLPRVFSPRRWCRRGSSTPAEKWVWSGYIRRCQRNIAHAQLFCTQALLGAMVRRRQR